MGERHGLGKRRSKSFRRMRERERERERKKEKERKRERAHYVTGQEGNRHGRHCPALFQLD